MHLLFAHTSPIWQPSSTVQVPPVACRTAQVPHAVPDFSQCVLMHCRLEPQPVPSARLPGGFWHDVGKLLLMRSAHVTPGSALAQSTTSAGVRVLSGSDWSLLQPSATRTLQFAALPYSRLS